MLILQVATVFLIAVAMALALAHALEFPGKTRLNKGSYLATQSIYYPGLTIGGGVGEGLGLVAMLLLLLLTPRESQAFRWILAWLLALAVMHIVFWTVTQPVNRHWVNGIELSKGGRTFFFADPASRREREDEALANRWEDLRDKWEYSHIVRAVLAAISLISLSVAVAIYGRS